MAECFYVFPHALMILVSALSLADARLYEAADALGTSRRAHVLHHHAAGRQVRPDLGRAGLLHAGDDRLRHSQGDRRRLQHAGDRRLQARHRPAGFPARRGRGTAVADPGRADLRRRRLVQRKQTAMLSARAIPYAPSPSRGFDALMLAYACLVSALMLAMLGMAIFASLATYWPYNLTPTLKPLRARPGRCRSRPGVRQQPPARRGHRLLRHDRSSSPAPTCSRRRAAWTALRPVRADAGDAAHGRARPGAGPRLHLLLQRARQSALGPVPDDDAPDRSAPSSTSTPRATSRR